MHFDTDSDAFVAMWSAMDQVVFQKFRDALSADALSDFTRKPVLYLLENRLHVDIAKQFLDKQFLDGAKEFPAAPTVDSTAVSSTAGHPTSQAAEAPPRRHPGHRRWGGGRR